jgi:DNA-directed RNA polymerase specialized sigma24 family protein
MRGFVTALPRYRDEGKPFEAYVYRIAPNKSFDVLRHRPDGEPLPMTARSPSVEPFRKILRFWG